MLYMVILFGEDCLQQMLEFELLYMVARLKEHYVQQLTEELMHTVARFNEYCAQQPAEEVYYVPQLMGSSCCTWQPGSTSTACSI